MKGENGDFMENVFTSEKKLGFGLKLRCTGKYSVKNVVAPVNLISHIGDG